MEHIYILNRIRELFTQPSSWMKHVMAQDESGLPCKSDDAKAAKWCLEGGVKKVVGTNMNDHMFRTDLYSLLYSSAPADVVKDILHLEYDLLHVKCQRINDHRDMTHEKLLEWLDRAIQLAPIEDKTKFKY